MLTILSLVACSSPSPSTSAPATTRPVRNTQAPGPIDVRISEIHYHAPAGRTFEEFVEIHNRGDGMLQMQGWCIEGIGYCFVESTIVAPDAYLIVTANDFVGSLSNKDDDISIVDPLGQILDLVSYSDREPWSELADGGGHSLQRVDFGADGSDPNAWESAPPTPGAPFVAAERATFGDVIVTEIAYHPEDDDPSKRFIEFTNTTRETIDVDGWCIEGADYCWSSPTPIDAGVALTIVAPPRLSRSSDRLRLVSKDGVVHDVVRYDDRDPWPAMADGHGYSLHRRNAVASGLEPGNWDCRLPSPGSHEMTADTHVIPIIEHVEFARSPEPGVPIEVSAKVRGNFDGALLTYRIGFDDEIVIPMLDTGSTITGTIPGQFPGSLVRFRIEVSGSVAGTYPRECDGAEYTGTVVASEADPPTSLTRFQWFIPDEVYDEAYATTNLYGDEGFSAVFAVNGELFDNVTIRVKGNQARFNKKRKWKVMLPPGHESDMNGLLESRVDEFDLLPSATDKSFAREILTSDLQALSTGVRQQVFPVRLEKNGEFFGLYMYGESSDADWRDKIGLSNDSLVYKAERVAKLSDNLLDLRQDQFRTYYQRYSRLYDDDDDAELRALIENLARMSDEEQIRFAYEHIDIPQVVEAIATMRVAQHPEWQHKNYFVVLDPVDERWRLLPIDFDLNFGRRYASPCNALCDEVRAFPWMDYPIGNRLARVFLRNDHFLDMVDRRTRTLADAFLAPGLLEDRLTELRSLMEVDADLDRKKWGQYGERQTLAQAQRILLDQYIVPKRAMYLESEAYLPPSQRGEPDVTIRIVDTDENGKVVKATLSNFSSIAVDVSGRAFEQLEARLPAGVVIRAGATIEVIFDRIPIDIDQAAPLDTLRLLVTAERLAPE